MTAAETIQIVRVDKSALEKVEWDNLPFGKVFTDHLLEADYIDGQWTNICIRPFHSMLLSPATAVFHYGQAIFEGIKAYRNQGGKVAIFRPEENFKRFNLSAARMDMPQVPEFIFMEGMRQLIELDAKWVPSAADHSLYIRPFMIATDEVIGVKPSETYKFMIILSPSGPYYLKPMRIYVEEEYTRAAPGGVGFAKNAGNYAGSMLATSQARRAGYDQVLWTDAFEHKYLQEVGVMNVFFLIGNKVITPSLEEGTILPGVTRNSAIELIRDLGYEVEERPISIDELISAYQKGEVKEIFGTGTAATIAYIYELGYRDHAIQLDIEKWTIAPTLRKMMNDIKYGEVTDVKGWMYPVN
ncbi:MAG: branched-chain amino acid aminotransferase [Sediminibacterium sp.]